MLTAIIAGLFIAFGLVVAFGVWFYARGRSIREAGRDYEGKVEELPRRGRRRSTHADENARSQRSSGP